MNTFLKRMGAYAIDYLIVYVIIYGIMLIPFVNPRNEEYQTKYNELLNVNEQYTKNEMSQSEYEEAFVPIAYDLYRLNGSYVIVSTICFLAYFGVAQFLGKGQTIGKKLFRIQVVSNNEKELSVVNYVLRAIVLYNVLIPIIELVIVYTMNVDRYLPVYQNINMVGYIIMYLTIFMILVRQDGRGLHDFVAGTKVIYDESLPLWKGNTAIFEGKETKKKEENQDSKKTKKAKESKKKAKPSEK